MYIAPHHSIKELKRLAKQYHCSQMRQRMQIIILGKQGKSFSKIATELGFARSTCIEWIGRYNKQNLKGLENRHLKGRSKPLTPEEENLFRSRIERGPQRKDKVCAFRGEDVRRILREEFGKIRSLGATYHLLHSLGYSCLSPRPRHPKGDSNQQEQFKKNSRGFGRDPKNSSAKEDRGLV